MWVHSREVAVLFVDTRPADAIVFHHDLLRADDPKSCFTAHGSRLRAPGSQAQGARLSLGSGAGPGRGQAISRSSVSRSTCAVSCRSSSRAGDSVASISGPASPATDATIHEAGLVRDLREVTAQMRSGIANPAGF